MAKEVAGVSVSVCAPGAMEGKYALTSAQTYVQIMVGADGAIKRPRVNNYDGYMGVQWDRLKL